jgi:hypothetical protein
MGGTILGSQGNLTSGVPTPRNKWRDIPQRVEYRATKEVLSLVFHFSFFTFSPFFSPPFFRHEDDWKATTDMWEDVGVHKDAQMFSGPLSVKIEVVRPRAFAESNRRWCICLQAPPTATLLWTIIRTPRAGKEVSIQPSLSHPLCFRSSFC